MRPAQTFIYRIIKEESLKDILSPNQKKEITSPFIIEVVAEHFGITPADIFSSKRSKEIVYPRQIAMYLCRKMTSDTLDTVGRVMGNKDHTTILHGEDKITTQLETDEGLRNTIEVLKKKINPG